MSLVTLRRLRPSAFCGSLDEEPRAETARRCGRRSRPRGFRGDRDRTDVPAPPRFLLSAAQGQNAPVLPLAGAGESDRGRRRRPTRHRGGRSGLRWRGGRSRICTSGPAAPRRAHCGSACRPACFPIRTRARERGAAGLTGSSHGGGAWRSVADGGRTPTRSSAKQRVPLGASTLLPVRHDSQGDTVSWAQSGAGQRRPRDSGFVLGAPPPLRIVPPEPRHRRVSGMAAPQLAACCTRRPWGHTRHGVWRASPLRSALAPGEASHPCALRAGVFHLHVTPLYVATSLQVRGNPRMQ